MTKQIITLLFVMALGVSVRAQTIDTYAGGGPNNVPATSANVGSPISVAVDGAGNVYIAAINSLRVYKVNAGTGILTAIAGNGVNGFSGDGGPATLANMGPIWGVAVDSVGNIYMADPNFQRIRKVSTAGIISTLAGNGSSGFAGDGGPATAASLNGPRGIAVDAAGNVYFADQSNSRIRKVDTGGTISTVAGNGTSGFSGDGGPAISARLLSPTAVAVDVTGNLYIGDTNNNRVRKVNPSGTISTFAGNGSGTFSGDGGPATAAGVNSPGGVTADPFGNVYIGNTGNQRIRKVNTGGTISTVAGNGSFPFSGDGGPATAAGLANPYGVAVDPSGNIYIASNANHRIRKVDPLGTISTFAGNGFPGYSGDGGPATFASLVDPYGVALDASSNLYIVDRGNNAIRKVTTGGLISTVAGSGDPGFVGDGLPFSSSRLQNPQGVAADAVGNIYIADTGNQRIRKVSTVGIVSTVAGTGTPGFLGDGGPATSARLGNPSSVAVDTAGNIYIADSSNQRIRKVSSGGTISTFAGTGTASFSGDGGPATSAGLNTPIGVAVDNVGSVYIADFSNHRIRKVNAGGTISTVAGTGTSGFSGDGGPATLAKLSAPFAITVEATGNIYIADASNQRVRKIDAIGTISTIAGNGSFTFSGDGGPATSASFASPIGVAVDASGNIYIADNGNQRIRRVQLVAATTVTVTCTAGSFTYDGAAQTPCMATVSDGGALNQSLTVSYTNNVNAGTATASASYAGDASHTGSSDSENFTIGLASSTTTVNCPNNVGYDGSAQTPCTASVTGAGGLSQSLTVNYTNNINAGTATASAASTGDANHTGSSDSTTFTIAKAATTTTVTCGAGPFTYDGSAQTPCTASVTGTGGLNHSLAVNYTNNINAGTATASASYAGDANHTGSSDSENFTIGHASSNVTVNCPTSIGYDGSPQTPCTASVTGAGGLNQSLTVNYTSNVSAGTATASAVYSGDDNHTASSDSTNFTIAKATTNTTVTCAAGPFTYDGSAQTPCTASVSGAGGLSQSLAVNYANNTDAGSASATASFDGDANHTASSDSKSFEITTADSATVVTCPPSQVYTGSAIEPCTVSVTGPGGLNLTPTASYTDNINVGSASASYTYTGDANHDSSSDSKHFAIHQATSTTTVTCTGIVTFNGSVLEPCTASVAGAGGLNQSLPVNYSNNSNAGNASASASYAGDANHSSSNDSTSFAIDKASSTTTVNCAAGPYTYSGAAQTPCTANITGVGGLNQSSTVNYTDNINAGTATASASFAGDANHHSSNDSKSFTINKALLTVTADNTSKLFGSSTPPTFTASFSGFVGGQTAASLGFVPTLSVKTMPLPGSSQTVDAATPVGTYAIVPNGLTSNNYSFTYNHGLLTVGVWTITGFYQPVDMNVSGYVINTVKGGSTVPLKFNIYAGTPGPLTERKSVADVMFGNVQFAEYPCTQTPGFEAPLEVTGSGNASLRYDTTGAQFIQNWQTPKAPNKCYQVRMTTLDGSHIEAYFKTK